MGLVRVKYGFSTALYGLNMGFWHFLGTDPKIVIRND